MQVVIDIEGEYYSDLMDKKVYHPSKLNEAELKIACGTPIFTKRERLIDVDALYKAILKV